MNFLISYCHTIAMAYARLPDVISGSSFSG